MGGYGGKFGIGSELDLLDGGTYEGTFANALD